MEDRLQAYRQPMVTATGIILGFVLNFSSAWVKGDSSISDGVAYAVFGLVIVGLLCLILVLSRVLRMGVEPERAAKYYSTTLTLFLVGVSCAVGGIMIDMFSNFMDS